MNPVGVPLPSGVSAGHWTDAEGRTGCTVVLAPDGAVAGVDVRGGAPGTLGTDALRPGRLVERAHAVLLTGGSAFGLDAAGGVMRYLDERGVGFGIGGARVLIVAGAVIFDLLTGDPRARPDAAAGYAACRAATVVAAPEAQTDDDEQRYKPIEWPLVKRVLRNLLPYKGLYSLAARHEWVAPLAPAKGAPGAVAGANTTIGVVLTDAELTREQANRVAAVAHDGVARAVRPAHTRVDGDTIFCLATGTVAAPPGADQALVLADLVEAAAAEVVARAIAEGVREGGRPARG